MVPKYGKNLWLCYMNTDSLIYNIKADDFYKDIAKAAVGKNKKIIIGLMKDELGGRIMTEFTAL